MTNVFLTGFPGFLGSALVERLLERHDEGTVTCLVQPKYRSKAEQRVDGIDAAVDADATQRVAFAEGDITDRHLAVDDYDGLADGTDQVYHLAAIYDLTVDRAPAKAVNIDGTRHMVEFAAAADADRLHYVSTVVVAGDYEGRFTEEMLQEGQSFHNYYESTKHMAEVAVRERMDEVPTTIYRPGVAVGDSETGETQKYDGMYAFVEGLVDQGDNAVIPAPRGASEGEFNVVPRDYIVDAIGYLSGIEESEGRTYHLADPDPLTTTELVRALGEAADKDRTVIVPYPKGILKGLLESLKPESELLRSGGLEYQTWPASFDCSNAVEDLAGSGIECPGVADYAGTLVEFYREHPDIGTEGMN
ncbi:Male sterility domain-containing protein [Haloglomus irregulare]|jgi:thioester reductase-like protein|uniref:Male sterility domain-containing protein n=1 Tax=Haloglomus irregulare TaxID=2234134 RepID=A0A554NFE3_9EURY|nr:SDR family oxidoreductase [Haloglomus irregulare]TSD16106.1 Male sterility domain-containing protein [Haloglomus irregulare]